MLRNLSTWSCLEISLKKKNRNIHLGNKVIERIETFSYLGTNITNQSYINEETKNNFKPENACYHRVQNVLSYSLLYKNMKIKINGTVFCLLYCGV
jgi:hypothetical protein